MLVLVVLNVYVPTQTFRFCYTFILAGLCREKRRNLDVTQDCTSTVVERKNRLRWNVVRKPVPFQFFSQSDSRKNRDTSENSVCAGNALREEKEKSLLVLYLYEYKYLYKYLVLVLFLRESPCTCTVLVLVLHEYHRLKNCVHSVVTMCTVLLYDYK
jgi:hypothetical protein